METYHITFSCYHKKWLFKSPVLYEAFQDNVNRTIERHSMQIYAYVLMPNHVHLVLGINENANLRKIIGSIKRTFAFHALKFLKEKHPQLYSSLKYKYGKRTGYRFWQRGVGRIQMISTDEQLTKTIEYIHNNPSKNGICELAEDWEWSSYKFWINNNQNRINLERKI